MNETALQANTWPGGGGFEMTSQLKRYGTDILYATGSGWRSVHTSSADL